MLPLSSRFADAVIAKGIGGTAACGALSISNARSKALLWIIQRHASVQRVAVADVPIAADHLDAVFCRCLERGKYNLHCAMVDAAPGEPFVPFREIFGIKFNNWKVGDESMRV